MNEHPQLELHKEVICGQTLLVLRRLDKKYSRHLIGVEIARLLRQQTYNMYRSMKSKGIQLTRANQHFLSFMRQQKAVPRNTHSVTLVPYSDGMKFIIEKILDKQKIEKHSTTNPAAAASLIASSASGSSPIAVGKQQQRAFSSPVSSPPPRSPPSSAKFSPSSPLAASPPPYSSSPIGGVSTTTTTTTTSASPSMVEPSARRFLYGNSPAANRASSDSFGIRRTAETSTASAPSVFAPKPVMMAPHPETPSSKYAGFPFPQMEPHPEGLSSLLSLAYIAELETQRNQLLEQQSNRWALTKTGFSAEEKKTDSIVERPLPCKSTPANSRGEQMKSGGWLHLLLNHS